MIVTCAVKIHRLQSFLSCANQLIKHQIFMIITRNFMPSKASLDAAIINNIHPFNHKVERSSLVRPSTALNIFNFIGKSMELPKPPYDVIKKKTLAVD